MSFGVNFGYAVQHLVDSQLNWSRAAHPVYLRLKNFPDPQSDLAAGMGFVPAPSGAGPLDSGTKDVLIQPPPAVTPVSLHNIGQSMGKLRFGAKVFVVSATFVSRQKTVRRLTNNDLVWRDPSTVGLVMDGLLFSIEDIKHKEAAGHTVAWLLTCNSSEIPNNGM